MGRPYVRLLVLFAWLVGFVLVSPRAFAYVPPPLVGAVNDTANLLSKEQRQALEERLAAHRKAHGHEVVVFTLPTLGGESIEDVAYGAFNTWKVGRKGKDDGVLLVIATGERRTRIETGKGVGGEITDLQSKRILSERVGPRMKEGNPARAIADGVDSILSLLLGGPLVPDGGTSLPSSASASAAPSSTVSAASERAYAPTGPFTDPSSAFPEPAATRFRADHDQAVREHHAAFAALVVDDDVYLPRAAGANVIRFCSEVPGTAGIVVVTRNAKSFYAYTCHFSIDHASLLDALTRKLNERLASTEDSARPLVFVEGFARLCHDLEAEKPLPGLVEPGFWARRYADGTFMLALPFGLIVGFLLYGYLAAKRGWNDGDGGGGGGGGGGGSSGDSSGGGSWSGGSSSGGSSFDSGYSGGSSGSSGGGYSGGGGSSGGGGASDGY
jgi:uncharacterized membrane protein YgcG